MFDTLRGKLSVALVAVPCLVTGMYATVTLYTSYFYHQEIIQRVNRKLAEDLVANMGLPRRGGGFDREAIERIFDAYMLIHPAIEVYLLDAKGGLLAYSAPPERIRLARVDLDPIHDFLHAPEFGLVLGDDPRDPGNRKPLSAAPIGTPHRPDGYLYVVLAGEQVRSAMDMLRSSYILRLGAWILAACLLFGLITGVLLFNVLTRRLRRLNAAIAEFRGNDLDVPPSPARLDVTSRDELGRLGRTFLEMAERIRQHLEKLKEADRLRRELVANVSHDLRTPMTSLQGFLETLLLKENNLTPADRINFLESALKLCGRLSTLVSELFDLAKLDSGHTRLRRESFPIGDLIQDVVLKFRMRAERKGIEIRTRGGTDLPLVYADIALIERVLDNLLDNALRHTPENGTVEISLDRSGADVSVGIADTGSGIPPEDREHIFDRFYQVEKGEAQAPNGAGLGLAIAKRILDLHGSRITVDTVSNHGTRFDFTLPVSG